MEGFGPMGPNPIHDTGKCTFVFSEISTLLIADYCTLLISDNKYPLPDDHPLHALKQGQGMDMLLELKDLPLEKVSQLRDFLKELKE